MDLTPIANHTGNAQAHLRRMYKQPRMLGLTAAFVGEVQAAENAVMQIATARFLDNATGATLDALGALKNVLRLGMLDDVYRAVIKGAIAAQFNQNTLNALRPACMNLFAGTSVFLKQPDNVDVSSAGRSACVAVGVGDSQLPASAINQSVAILQNALPAGVVLSRVFSFPAALGALSAAGAAPWVRGFGTGYFASVIYTNPIA